ncbi:MAG: glycoside-pentoside-hexuronide (GPH):cation symporter [Parabacteroides sp.]|nr:glycoside-pentoside-hexuronide (GPH):cation symporter [Parabacteroides sp.]
MPDLSIGDKALNRKLTVREKIGYGSGSVGDAIAYDFVVGFLLFFLTEIAGINPALAGTIILVAVLWDAITDPLIGLWSDRTKCKYGRKRPFLLGSAIPLGLAMVFLFSDVQIEGIAKGVYYIILAMIFWTAYTAFNIPYFALGGCITLNAEERTKIRSIAQSFNFIGVFCASAVPTFLISRFKASGSTDAQAWQYAVIVIAAIAAITILISWRGTRGQELIIEDEETAIKGNLFKEIWEIMQIKPYRNVILANLLFYMTYTISTSSILFYVQYHLGKGEGEASIIYTGITIAGIVVALSLGPLGVKFDKRMVYIACCIIAGVIMIGAKFVVMGTLAATLIYCMLFNIGSAGHWTLSYTLLYDVFEFDDLKNGRRREGMLMSYFSFCGKIGGALAGQISGLLLYWGGYNATFGMNQTPEAMNTIKTLFTVFPGILSILCGVVIILYPITREKHALILEKLELKKAGKPYTIEGLEKLL